MSKVICCAIFLNFVAVPGAFVHDVTSSDVHERHTNAVTIFDAGTASENWIYYINTLRSTKGVSKYVRVDPKDGRVRLVGSSNCGDTNEKSVRVFVEAMRTERSVKTHVVSKLTVRTDGMCAATKQLVATRNRGRNALFFDGTNSIVLSADFNRLLEGACYGVNQTVADLGNILPRHLVRCHPSYVVRDSGHRFSVSKDGKVRAVRTVCWDGDLSFLVYLESLCAVPYTNAFNVIPYRVVVKKTRATVAQSPATVAWSPALVRKRRQSFINTSPRFGQATYDERVGENEAVGTVVATIVATDTDVGGAGQVQYAITASQDTRSASMFQIDGTSGQITTKVSLDREVIATHYFKILATDFGNPPKTAQADLVVRVADKNDNAPAFGQPSGYLREVDENQSLESTVETVHATDKDVGQNSEISYSIVRTVPDRDAFTIDSGRGSIRSRTRLDREDVERYTLTVVATDRGVNRMSSEVTVEIIVRDLNDNRPQFTQSAYVIDVPEDIDTLTSPPIGLIRATDADAAQNGHLTYSITGGNSRDTFFINGVSGELKVIKALDRETVPVYQLTVRAIDQGNPPKSNSTSVRVRVTDVNDNAPRFYSSSYTKRIYENVGIGTTVVQVSARDWDAGLNGHIVYSIEGAPAHMPLVINANTGTITANGKLDHEVANRYGFNVVARDQGSDPKSSTATVTITIIDLNDNEPRFDRRVYDAALSEDSQPGKNVIDVVATDADAIEHARISYTISGGNIGNVFDIFSEPNKGVIQLIGVLDYKQRNRYILTVMASDGQYFDTARVKINVTDANTFAPKFQGGIYRGDVDENLDVGRSVFRVHAKDEDVGSNAAIAYSIQDASDHFSIDPTSGVISLKRPLDRERTSGYTLTVTARDHGTPQKSDQTDVELTVLDINDNHPVFVTGDSGIYKDTVKEEASVGISVATITATDADQGLNGNVRYTFQNGNSGNGDFEIDHTHGTIRVAKLLDRERVATYDLVAFAVDHGRPELSTSVTISVRVIDANDNPPQFESATLVLYIDENSRPDSRVGYVTAIDPDEGVNAVVEYSIQGGSDANSFSLIQKDQSAEVISKTEFDFESEKTQYSIIVRAKSAPLFSDATVLIRVRDVNDNAPTLNDFEVVVNNFKNRFPTGVIGRVPAEDLDRNDRLSYKFTQGNAGGLLILNQWNGTIQLDPRLNSDRPTSGRFTTEVSDGINKVTATCTLTVRLITDDMLYNSITVQLKDMTIHGFLSARDQSLLLYSKFVTGLAQIYTVQPRDVYIFNILDGTIEQSSPILNVSFSVRKEENNNVDVFYNTRHLKERVYLQRLKLEELSFVKLLPFDDNLCINEPCVFFEDCVTQLQYGSAAAFIHSKNMIFRPIHPIEQFDCLCRVGFTGMTSAYLCDTEVNTCYSSPCKNNGTCVRQENDYTCKCLQGFVGKNCEYDASSGQSESCPSDVCRPPSRCVKKIVGGFRCDGCPTKDYMTDYCEVTTRTFTRGSLLMYPSLNKRHRFKISLEFSTREKNALLFYNGRFNGRHDFVLLEIASGQVRFSYSLGSEVETVSAYIPGGVNDGDWHRVTLNYLNKVATLSVGADCDTDVQIKYASLSGQKTCAAQKTLTLPSRCDKPTVICHRFLDLSGPLQIGGMPTSLNDTRVKHRYFAGCIKNFYIDGKFLDLNGYAWENGTSPGCAMKNAFCSTAASKPPCKNEGVCHDAWNSFRCDCPPGSGGKDCSQGIEPPRRLEGSGLLTYNPGLPNIALPWYNGLAFRTRQADAILMKIEVGASDVLIELADGFVKYTYPQSNSPSKSVLFDDIRVNDGAWHYLEVRWLKDLRLLLTMDYNQVQKSLPLGLHVAGAYVGKVYVGGRPNGQAVQGGFVGCVQNVRVGNNPSPLTSPSTRNVIEGCDYGDVCQRASCPTHGRCVSDWDRHRCRCDVGYLGSRCGLVCSEYNPCSRPDQCVPSASTPRGYTCECGPLSSGRYCQETWRQPCPASWWGNPICGPCNCPTHKGFKPNCNKTTGVCYCKDNYYQPAGSGSCFPCKCYVEGSFSTKCDRVTGQCQCKSGVTGRRCDACASKNSAVTLRGCEVVYNSCPKVYLYEVWWAKTDYNKYTVQPCPDGTYGNVTRYCDQYSGWREPDMYNCTSNMFKELKNQLDLIERGLKPVVTRTAKLLMEQLKNATNETATLYGTDVNVTCWLVVRILEYETRQKGLNLTHLQNSQFTQNMLNSLSKVLLPKYSQHWKNINDRSGGAAELLYAAENYMKNLVHNMAVVFPGGTMAPFDVVSENIVFGMDTIRKQNFTGTRLPKYNNKVQNEFMFDKDSYVSVPPGIITSLNRTNSVAASGYILFKTLGNLLPVHFNPSQRTMNTPVFLLTLQDGQNTFPSGLPSPLTLHLDWLNSAFLSNPKCVYWKFNREIMKDGYWSSDGCTTLEDKGDGLITCQCNHLTSFAAILDLTDLKTGVSLAFPVETITYVAGAISLFCLLWALIVFCCLTYLQSNSNSIHIHLVLCILITEIIYVFGIDRTEPILLCKLVAILLHYFFLCVFSWMFVEGLHIYRMLTEVRNIDRGSMKFYYLVGYLIPGIIVGLAVGLKTDAYGNKNFCWMKTDDIPIWSFVGPVIVLFICTVVMFVKSIRVSCNPKLNEPENEPTRHLLVVSLVLLPVLSVTWAFGLLAVNHNVRAYHYLFAIFNGLAGVIVLVAYILLNKWVRAEMTKVLTGNKGMNDGLSVNRPKGLSRSALAYAHDSSLDGGLNRFHNIGISTTSTTSRSTSKASSGGLYRPDGYLRSTSTSTSGHNPYDIYPNTGIAPYGYTGAYDSKLYGDVKTVDDPDTGEVDRTRKRVDSDSDSDLSVAGDLELASSHSSDDDDDELTFGNGSAWRPKQPQNKHIDQLKPQRGPQHSTPMYDPPAYSVTPTVTQTDKVWPGEVGSNYTLSDTEVRDLNQIKVSDVRRSTDKIPIPDEYISGNEVIMPPERADSLPNNDSSESNYNIPPRSPPKVPPKPGTRGIPDRPLPDKVSVPVLTHNGSITSDESDGSHETEV